MGGCFSAFSIMMIAAVGWRSTNYAMGLSGVVVGLASLLLMKEPERIVDENDDCEITEPMS